MKCPKCNFEQTDSESCIECGIVFSKYKSVQERKREADAKRRQSREHSFSKEPVDLKPYIAGSILIILLLARSLFFLQFPAFLDPYFRFLMLVMMFWLGFKIVPRFAGLMTRLDKGKDNNQGLDGFNIYDKKAIFLFFSLGSVLISFLVWSILSGSIECFSGRNRTCHEIYDSVADPGEFWVTALINYFLSIYSINFVLF